MLVAGLSPDRVAQLVRLFLEVPWAFYKPNENIRSGRYCLVGVREWEHRVCRMAAIEACLEEEHLRDAALDISDNALECMRDLLATLVDCYSTEDDGVRRAREYFGITPLPKPDFYSDERKTRNKDDEDARKLLIEKRKKASVHSQALREYYEN